ncbi:signal transducer and activator of transcription 2 [Porphyrio hochstetteri]
MGEDRHFFSSPPPAPWPRLAEVLSWQFESVAERGLSRDHLLMLAEKLFAVPECTLAWPKFSKDGASGFSFWSWLDGILGLLQEHLKQLWKNNLILGFVSRKQEKKLLKGKRTGTFLIRFSESILGGVTCTWVEHPDTGPPAFRAVVPYTATELASLALPDIIRDYQLLVEENIPENPLRFLYPDIARDEAFGPYYSQREEGTLTEQKKYLNRRLIRVSSRQANESWQTEEELVVATENLETLQLQHGGLGTGQPGSVALLQPGSSGTLQVTSGTLGTLQPLSPGTVQVAARSPGTLQPAGSGTLQPRPQGLEPSQQLQVGSGVSEMLQPGTEDLKPPLVLQLVPNGQGTLLVGSGAMGVLQVLPGGLGMLQHVGPEQPGAQQVGPGVPEPPGVMKLDPNDQRMLDMGHGGLGTLQVVPPELEPPAMDRGMLHPVQGAPEPLSLNPNMQQFLESLVEGVEQSSGMLDMLEASELMPDVLGAMDGGLDPSQPSAAVLLDPDDPFLPQPDDTTLPTISSLFTADIPPLHIDATDFQ